MTWFGFRVGRSGPGGPSPLSSVRRPTCRLSTVDCRLPRRLRRRGFTLLELIVVITIIGILGTMVVVKVGGWAAKARVTKIKSDLKAIVSAAEMYQVSTGRYPQTLEELKSGKDASGNDIGSSIEQTKDPWNNEYLFELGPDGKPRARCLGQDGADGGDGDNKDYEEPDASGTQ